jgi:hypothetical protein
MTSLLVTNQVYLTTEFLETSAMFFKRDRSSKFAPKVYEGFLLGYDSKSCACCVFNMDSGCVEITCDVVFD